MHHQQSHKMISIDEAFEVIDGLDPVVGQSLVLPVRETLNNVLREDVIARTDSPRRDNTAMDGFVFRKQDLDGGRRQFPVAGDIRPEMDQVPPLEPGTCARIMTGAAIPEGGDFVVPVEQTRSVNRSDDEINGKTGHPPEPVKSVPDGFGVKSRSKNMDHAPDSGTEWVEVLEIPKKNAIRRQGEGFRRGDVLIRAGTVLRPYDLGLVIESGNNRCVVQRPLRIGLQISGSEITTTNNINGPVLHAILSSWPGTDVREWPVLADDPGAARTRLQELKEESDVIITSGGISAGRYDYLYDALTDLGADCLIRKVRQKPGKPVTVFRWDGVTVICLPGNPVSATAIAELYARRIVLRLQELPADPVFGAFIQHELSNPGNRTLFMPAALSVNDGMLWVGSRRSMRSHLMQQYRGSRVYLRLEPDAHLKAGDKVTCHAVTDGYGPAGGVL